MQIIDGTDLKVAAWQYIEEEKDPAELIKLKKGIRERLSWADFADTWEVRERAMDPLSQASSVLRKFAENEQLWLVFKPTPEEVETIEQRSVRRRSPGKTPEDYILILQRLRNHKKDSDF